MAKNARRQRNKNIQPLWVSRAKNNRALRTRKSKHILRHNKSPKRVQTARRDWVLRAKAVSQARPALWPRSGLLGAVNNVSSVDLCFDKAKPFNLDAFEIVEAGSTAYVKTELMALERVYFYDKAKKNNLNFPLYRAEATALIVDLNKPALLPRAERLELQLRQAVRDFSQIIDLATKARPPKLAYKAHNNKRELRA